MTIKPKQISISHITFPHMYNIRNIGIASIIDPNAYNTKKCYSHITILNTYNSKQNTKKLLLHTS